MSAYLNALGEEGTVAEITTEVVRLRDSLGYEPYSDKYLSGLTRGQLFEELCVRWEESVAKNNRFKVKGLFPKYGN